MIRRSVPGLRELAPMTAAKRSLPNVLGVRYRFETGIGVSDVKRNIGICSLPSVSSSQSVRWRTAPMMPFLKGYLFAKASKDESVPFSIRISSTGSSPRKATIFVTEFPISIINFTPAKVHKIHNIQVTRPKIFVFLRANQPKTLQITKTCTTIISTKPSDTTKTRHCCCAKNG